MYKIFKNLLGFSFFNLIVVSTVAQDTLVKKHTIETLVYIETYYSYDFSKPDQHEKAPFLYNYNRHNEVNINLALASLFYKNERSRAVLGLMAGTYTEYNLASEPQVLQHIFEANGGLKLSENEDLWIDAGILPSHIGFESAIGKDCQTLTRSILAENSPYFETGIRLSYAIKNGKWYIAGLLLNGWQRIRRVPGNNAPAFGTQVTYSPSNKLSITSSTFIGNDQPDIMRQWRYFHNLYSTFEFLKILNITLGFDYGREQKHINAADFNNWYAPIAIISYEKDKWAVAARAEYYSDKQGVIVPLINAQPFQMQGYSLNTDRRIGNNAVWRLELRFLKNKYPYFLKGNEFTSSNYFATTSLAINFSN